MNLTSLRPGGESALLNEAHRMLIAEKASAFVKALFSGMLFEF